MSNIRGRRELIQRLGRISAATQQELRRALRRSALLVENTAVQKIMDGPKTGKIYRSRGDKTKMHQASAPGEPPAADTGELHTSITHAEVPAGPETIRFEVAANAPYATALELGTSKMEPRPFMAPSLAENEDAIRVNLAAAVRRGSRRR